jgi:TolB-like protein
MKKIIIIILCCITLFIIHDPIARAGQVVTDNDKVWARTVIDQEKSRKTVLAPNTLAVLYFRNKTGQTSLDPLQKGFALLLMTDLAQVENIQLVERVKFQALVEELNIGEAGIVDNTTAPRVGKLLGAGYLVGGDLTGSQTSELGVKSNLLQVKNQSSLGQPTAAGQMEQIFDMEKKILFKIIDLLKIKLTPEKKAKLEKPFTTDLNAFLSFMNGIESSDRGNYRDAEQYYNKAIREDPQLRPAQDALNELRSLNLVSAPGKSRTMLRDLGKSTSNTTSLSKDYPLQESDNPGVIQKRETESGDIKVKW